MHKFVVVTLIGVAALFSAKLAGQDSSGTIYRRPLPATWTVRSSQPAQMNAIALKNAGGAPSPPTNTWTFIQEGYWSHFGAQSGSGGSNCGSPLVGTLSCTVNLPQPITPGNLLVVLPLFYSGDIVTLTGISGESITKCTSCQLLNPFAIQLDAGYTLNANGGQNQVTCYFSAATTGWQGCAVIEAHWSGSSISFDAGNASLGPCSTICAGVNVSLNGNDDFIIQSNFPFDTDPLSVSSPYNFFQGSYGYLLDATIGQGGAPIWLLPQADPATSNNAIAFTGQ